MKIIPHLSFHITLFLSFYFLTSLFKAQVLNSGDDPLNSDDRTDGGRQTASRPQTFHSQVPMATVPPPPPQLPQATVRHAAPPLSPQRLFSPPPPLGSSAASGRPPQQAARAEMQDKGTKRVFVQPLTPQPLLVQGAALNWHRQTESHCAHMPIPGLANNTRTAYVKCST